VASLSTGLAVTNSNLTALSTSTSTGLSAAQSGIASLSTGLAPILAASEAANANGGALAGTVTGTGGAPSGQLRTNGGLGDNGAGDYTFAQASAQASGIDSMATGTFASVTPEVTGGTAYGAWSNVSGTNGTAIGYRTVAGAGSVAVGFENRATGSQSIAIGYRNLVTGNGSGAIGDPNVISGNGSYAVGNNNTIASNNVFVLGNGVNVAAGNDGAVVLGNGSTASGSGTVSVGAANAERRITNVAAGINATDAVNVSQLNSGLNNLQGQITGLQGQVTGLQGQVFDLRETTGFGIAGATAIAMIPDIQGDQRFALGMGVGGFDEFQAVAIGFTGRLTDNVTVKGGVSLSERQSTYGMGVSIGW